MIEISLAAGSLLVCAGWIVFRLLICRKTGRVNWKQECIQLLFLVNLLVIYRMTFHPFAKVDGRVQPLIFEFAALWPLRVNLVPFVHMMEYDTKFDLVLNLIGNSAMFLPTGILVPLLYPRLAELKKTVLTGFGLSLAIELLQLPFAVRASDVDDLILNTLGCLTGYGIYALVKLCFRMHR